MRFSRPQQQNPGWETAQALAPPRPLWGGRRPWVPAVPHAPGQAHHPGLKNVNFDTIVTFQEIKKGRDARARWP